ncbi:MAG: pyridoxal phosphate-dependent aminotransferase, partial [Bdellovibrionales bacterium]|nr:pyridoxal phosphate-dependent aminotransferase [Bdellovibrionales bacterium]
MSQLIYDSGMTTFQLSPTKAIELQAARIPGAISLAQGIPSFATPQVIKDFVLEKIQSGLCDKYSLTSGLSELREEIALGLSSEGLLYDPDGEILVTAGSIEAITASILALTNPGDEVIIPSPTYVSYLGSISIAHCKVKYVALDEDNNFEFDLQRMADAISSRTKAILYCSPNNPTGTVFSKENSMRILELAEQHDLKIIVDEVYKDFYYSSEPHFSPASISSLRERIVRVCSFSKAYAMTGWRVAFLHSSRSNVNNIIRYHDALVTCAPVASQYAAIAALRYGASALESFHREFKRRRDYCISRLDELSHVIDYQIPKATYFVFPRLKDSAPYARDSHSLA